MTRSLLPCAALLALAIELASPAAFAQQIAEPADLILHNTFVWTVDEANPQAEAVAIRGDRIVAVGTDEEIMRHRGSGTRLLDLNGAFVLPGFNDNHTHFNSASSFHEFNIMTTSTQEEFVERARGVVERIEPGEWIGGGLWGAYDQWAAGSAGGDSREPFAPDMRLVEEITAENPMLINKFDNSEFAANRAAFAAAGLDFDNPPANVPRVEFLRDAEGNFRGVMRGAGAPALFARAGGDRSITYERRVARTKHALSLIAEAGVTNISDMSDDLQVRIFEELRDSGELTVRVHYRYMLDRWKELADKGIRVGSGDAWIRFGSLKGHIDGIMGTSSARFFEPYDSDPLSVNRGRWRPLMFDENDNTKLDPDRFRGLMIEADKAGLQLTVHAIGDEANNVLMNFMDDLLAANGAGNRRFRLVHAQVIAPEDFARLGPLGMIAEVQPYHLSDDMRWMEERIGHARCEGAYAFKSIADAGAILSFGTDWPGTSAAEYPINPMLGLYAAVTRETVQGTPAGGWFPEQKIDIRTAIRAYTLNTAFANFEEDAKGSIEEGKLADITVMDRNLLEIPAKELLDAKALYTIVNGRIVFERN